MLLWALGFAFFVSVGAVGLAAVLLLLSDRWRRTLLDYLVGYATGALLAAALVSLLPHAAEHAEIEDVLATVLAGLVVFFVLERLLVWRHCHAAGVCELHGAAPVLVLVGDALHNFVDGVVIASAFLTSIPLGISTGMACMAHELPQELGDFAILLQGGFSRGRALLWNAISGGTAVLGALLAYLALASARAALPYVLAFAAASFLYIGLADLVPGLQDRRAAHAGSAGGQFVCMLAGIATMVVLEAHA